MKIFDILKKNGIVTSSYPFSPYEVEEYYRGKPVYDYKFCISCAACGVACPSNAITVKYTNDKQTIKWQYNCGRCIFCGRCDEVCPTGAIKLSNDYELAVKFDKNALIQEGEFESFKCKICHKSFTSKKFIEYSKQKLAHLAKERLLQAEEYLELCQECKQNKAVDLMAKKEYGAIK